jgi:hypothetical protein
VLGMLPDEEQGVQDGPEQIDQGRKVVHSLQAVQRLAQRLLSAATARAASTSRQRRAKAGR